MSGICGIALNDRTQQESFAFLKPMLRELDPARKSKGHTKIGVGIGSGVQDFPGRMSGMAELQEHGRTHLFGFHGSIYNLKEVLVPFGTYDCPFLAMLKLALQGVVPFLHTLRGDFVLSVWDAQKETLFLASDRFRVHPIFYRQDQEKFVFSSRMRGLLACSFVDSVTVDPLSIIDVVTSSYIPTPRTIFREVRKIPPGQLLTWKQGEVKLESYWDLSFLNSSDSPKNALVSGLKERFSESIMVRMKEDDKRGPIGSFLSGGIDSSTVLGVMTQSAKSPMNTFSIGFGEEAFNETSFARCAAGAFQAQQHEYVVTPENTFQVVDELVESFDEPYANASAIPTYFCAKLAKEHGMKFLYGGDGGDELFAGNERYATQKIFDYYGKFPRWFRDLGVQPAVFLLAKLLKAKLFLKGKKYIERANIPYPERLLSWGLLEVLPMEELFSRDFLLTVGDYYDPHRHIRELYSISESLAKTELDRQLYIDLKLVISDNDIFKVTRMTEAHGIAVRFPFLDHRLAEFAASIPAHIKMRGTKLRTFFKESYADLLPKEILTKTKQGFGLPIPIWLKTDKKLREMMMDLLLSERFCQRGYFTRQGVETLIKRHQEDTTSFYGTILWNLVILELWLRRYTDHR